MTTGVCVVGAGPAGSTVARRLALLGHEVCLVERAAFPRPHVGESLAPSILPVLDQLGVRDRIEDAGFLRPDRAVTRWGATPNVIGPQETAPGFQVDRERFDTLLLEAAREAGVRIVQPATVIRVERDARRLPVASIRGGGSIHAQFIVDATGRSGVLPRHRRRTGSPTAALYAYWNDAPFHGAEARIEASSSAWYWGAPLPSGVFNAAAFVSPERCRGLSAQQRDDFYRQLLSDSVLLAPCLRGTPRGAVRVCDAAPFMDDAPVGDRTVKAGEAAFAVDPLSSQGVQVAMTCAFAAAAVVHTLRHLPDRAEIAQRFYRERIRETASRHARLANDAYRSAGFEAANTFWGPRAGERPVAADAPRRHGTQPAAIVRLSPLARLEVTPVLDGAFIAEGIALDHPNLTRRLAFLGNLPVAPLLADLSRPMPVDRLLASWRPFAAPAQGRRLLDWLLAHGVVEPCP